MQAVLISMSGGIFIYLMILIRKPVSEKIAVRERIKKYFRRNSMEDIEDQVIRERYEKYQRKKAGSMKLVSRELADYVSSSGIRLTPSEFLYAWVGIVFIPMIFLLLFRTNMITIIAIFIIGLSVPPVLLRRAREKRQEAFTKQLGEALVVIGNAMKGGFSFRQAMESVTADMQPPISVEFEKTLREIRFGVSLEEALQHMSERLKNQDLNLLVSAVITSAKVGGNLSDTLDTISSTIKDRIRIKQEVRVLTSSGRISSIIIGLLPVLIVLTLMILNPDYFGSFFESMIGKIMIAVSVLLETIGFLLIKKIADIKY